MLVMNAEFPRALKALEIKGWRMRNSLVDQVGNVKVQA